MLIKRVPEWYQDDSLVKTVNDEISFTEINSYYDYLRSYVEQPIQIWREIKSLDPLDAKIKIRLNADSAYPLREVNLYESCLGNEDDGVLFTKKYRRYDKVITDFIEYTNEPTLENCYVEVKYWCLSGSIAIGFPQDSNATDETFLPNTFLDKHAKTYGLFRRTYRDNITTEDLPYTYPMGYPYSTEQDYFLEKRILEEYGNRLDKIKEVTLHDTNNLKTVRLTPKIAGVHDIEIITHANKVDIIDNQKYDTIITESYVYTDARSFEEDVLRNSKILTAKVINESNLPLTSESQWIRMEGTYQRWGLLESEINQYLGVIPEIKDMADYILIWDRRTWDNYVWAGEDFNPGVFQVRIPYANVPANFNLLTMDEIQTIINKCKKLGTKGIPTYIYDSYLDLSTTINSVDENIGVAMDLDLDLTATTMDRAVDLDINLNPLILQGVENCGGTTAQVYPFSQSVYPNHTDLPLSLSLDTTTMYSLIAKTLDTQADWYITVDQMLFDKDSQTTAEWYTTKSSAGYIQINTSYTDLGRFCTPIIPAITADSGYTGRWGVLSQTLTEPLPSGCSVTYDIFREYVDQQQTSSNGTDIFGTPSSNEEWCQGFNPNTSSLTGISLWAMGVQGTPTDNILISICTIDSNHNPKNVIQTTSIPAASWPTNGEIKIPFDITGLNTTATAYGIWLHRSGSLNSTNYYKFRIQNTKAYDMGCYCQYNYKGTWQTANSGNWSIYFKTWYPSNLLTGQTAPVNLRNISYTNIKIRGNLTTTDITKTPKIDKIILTREEVAS